MNLETLDQAILEAARFVRKAKELKKARADKTCRSGEITGRWSTMVESAACKRASMDLARILADLRNGR